MQSELITRSEAGRFESLGDNCEFGFVMRKLGFEIGSLFRWARMTPNNLVGLLQGNLKNFYDYENLIPLRFAMVQDLKYNIGWHTTMHSHHTNGSLVFVDDDKNRKSRYDVEKDKFDYLCSKFLARLKAGGVIYVIKDNTGVPSHVLEDIYQELKRLSEGAKFWLLEVTSTDVVAQNIGSYHFETDTPGEVYVQGSDRLVGLVREFADYNHANECDYKSWNTIVERVIQLTSYNNWDASIKTVDEDLTRSSTRLKFPNRRTIEDALICVTDYDFGLAMIETHHTWSRQIDGFFRLHAATSKINQSFLSWKVHNSPGSVKLKMYVQLAVQYSRPVNLNLVCHSENRIVAMEKVNVESTVPQIIAVQITCEPGLLLLHLEATAEHELSEGQVAVVDITEPELQLIRSCL